MTTVIDFTPTRADMLLWVGDDNNGRIFISIDAPDFSAWAGTWNTAVHYQARDIVEFGTGWYYATDGSVALEPASNPDVWTLLTPFDLTDYTSFHAEIRSTDNDEDSFAMDTTGQADGVIGLSLAAAIVAKRHRKGPQQWSIGASDPNGEPVTFFAGKADIAKTKP